MLALVAAAGALAVRPAAGGASGWLPHPDDATWTYEWSDSVYESAPLKEKVTVETPQKASSFTLDWTSQDLGNAADAPPSKGSVTFADGPGGLVDTSWSLLPPPSDFPVLCASPQNCLNSLVGSWFNVIWGNYKTPVLAEPLLVGARWAGTGGVQNDVGSVSAYEGVETVTVPAFPLGVPASKIRTDITQAGALGDPYGSGVRTTWWVYGVGPVKVVFQHAGGTSAPVSTVVLDSTNQAPKPAPPDTNWFPLTKGLAGTYRWTNAKYLSKPEVEHVSIDQVANGSASVSVKSVSGPIKVNGAYVFTARTDGVTSFSAQTKAASLAKLPPLGPGSVPVSQRRHFFTPLDLMVFGFNPVLPAYPVAGDTWQSDASGRDFQIFGVTGRSTVLGISRVTVPAGTFRALGVRSVLKQPGFPFGSGTRTSWFAPGRGLVKLVFSHGDGSVSRVELLH
ncbi:MAG: hypothetical protein QOK22_652 [Gaiellaceae bacterium]|jgi:hypothetical protein|nr:hypothetical protein [Gaiellaceae bacterium]